MWHPKLFLLAKINAQNETNLFCRKKFRIYFLPTLCQMFLRFHFFHMRICIDAKREDISTKIERVVYKTVFAKKLTAQIETNLLFRKKFCKFFLHTWYQILWHFLLFNMHIWISAKRGASNRANALVRCMFAGRSSRFNWPRWNREFASRNFDFLNKKLF